MTIAPTPYEELLADRAARFMLALGQPGADMEAGGPHVHAVRIAYGAQGVIELAYQVLAYIADGIATGGRDARGIVDVERVMEGRWTEGSLPAAADCAQIILEASTPAVAGTRPHAKRWPGSASASRP
ncbi:hypothetical protein [Streptomyces sp. NPDC051183]|uniref:hypothetical protein n=1 Tax=Streptomyces sp. NPDC051183 TaxID=3155165 RepID=UPI003418D136